MSTVSFLCNSKCDACDLCQVSPKICHDTKVYQMKGKSKAVLFVGHAPDYHGSYNNEPFYGNVAKVLFNDYISYVYLGDDSDIYASSVARCCPDQNQKVKMKEFKLCSGYIIQDLETLSLLYDSLCVVLLGAQAVRAFYKYVVERKESMSLAKGISENGKQLAIPQKDWKFTVFSTYHPNMVLFEKNNANAVHTHMKMVKDWTQDIKPMSSKPVWIKTISPFEYKKGDYELVQFKPGH